MAGSAGSPSRVRMVGARSVDIRFAQVGRLRQAWSDAQQKALAAMVTAPSIEVAAGDRPRHRSQLWRVESAMPARRRL